MEEQTPGQVPGEKPDGRHLQPALRLSDAFIVCLNTSSLPLLASCHKTFINTKIETSTRLVIVIVNDRMIKNTLTHVLICTCNTELVAEGGSVARCFDPAGNREEAVLPLLKGPTNVLGIFL